MKPSRILRRAANMLANGYRGCACVAIGQAGYLANGSQDSQERLAHAYFDLFRPPGCRTMFWFGSRSYQPNQLRRYTALLFAAEVAEGEGQ
jgi:hypothetical protein